MVDHMAVGVEGEQHRFPRLTAPACPQRRTHRARDRDRRGDAAAATHGPLIYNQAYRRVRFSPGSHRMPERGGAARGRRAREKEQHAGERRTRTVGHAPQCRAAQCARDARRRQRDHGGGTRVGSKQQRRARTDASACGRTNHADDAAGASARGAFDHPAQRRRVGLPAREQHDPHRRSRTRHDEGPREGDSRHRRRQREPERGRGQRRAEAAEHHGECPRACVRGPQATQPARRLRHLVSLTAYVKRFTPMRNAAS